MEEIQKKDAKELKKLIAEKREEIRKARFGVAEQRNPKAQANLRKEIARIFTHLNAQAK